MSALGRVEVCWAAVQPFTAPVIWESDRFSNESVAVSSFQTRNTYIRHSGRVSLHEIYSSLSEAFHKAHADEIEVPGIKTVSALGEVHQENRNFAFSVFQAE